MNRSAFINLQSGVYAFDSSSAIGKTLLLKMIKSLGETDKIAITYHDMLLGIDLNRITERKPKLLLLDRFDLYDENAFVLEKLKNTDSIVLVDYKTQRHFCDFDDTCFVDITKDSVEVSL